MVCPLTILPREHVLTMANAVTSSTVTVLLFTCQRASMLREALESIRRQTARAAIARVVVSENSLDTQSEAVCAQFSDLPILYIQQRPPVAPLLHPRAIWEHVNTPAVAILHDDDWWASTHLRASLDVLDAKENCAAVFSSFFESYGPNGVPWLNQSYYFSWIAAGADTMESVAYMDRPAVMLACLLNAGLHYSTVVARAEPLRDAFERNVARGNSFDNDRTFPVFLSEHGPVGYVLTPEVFIRNHPTRFAWEAEYLKVGHMKLAQSTTRWLAQHYPQEVSEAAARFNAKARALDSSSAHSYWKILKAGTFEPQWSTLVKECGVDLSAMRRERENTILPLWAREVLGGICPPVMNRWLQRLCWEQLMLFKKRRANARAAASKQ